MIGECANAFLCPNWRILRNSNKPSVSSRSILLPLFRVLLIVDGIHFYSCQLPQSNNIIIKKKKKRKKKLICVFVEMDFCHFSFLHSHVVFCFCHCFALMTVFRFSTSTCVSLLLSSIIFFHTYFIIIFCLWVCFNYLLHAACN